MLHKGAPYPFDPPGVAHILRARRLADIESQHGPERARDAIDLVAATVSGGAGFVEHAIFIEDLVDGCAPTFRFAFPKLGLCRSLKCLGDTKHDLAV